MKEQKKKTEKKVEPRNNPNNTTILSAATMASTVRPSPNSTMKKPPRAAINTYVDEKAQKVFSRVRVIHSQIKSEVFGQGGNYHDLIHKLITCDKLLLSTTDGKAEQKKLRMFNTFQLLLVYHKMGDTARIFKYFSAPW
eukprot:CAMPEP_0170511290 /NCGR_PEP_ID=MMETSP0208-20121228/66226_1 /TAXON_ID=197538 /ORGANISM="Strombidium inclinatum, Strain S3" /LENGTH=138 /DNA_ID=CAMNT_0010794821 /DNA_START=579 /DNA_END=995 /DNA_ORIENTATION=+